MLFRYFFVVTGIILSLHANTYIVVDISQGISTKEWKEVGGLAFPDRIDNKNIYINGEKIYLYAFNGSNALSKDLTYMARNENESIWKNAHLGYNKFFSQLKKYGIKKQKYVNSNIIFLIDTSGSMKKNSVMDDVKRSINYLIAAKSKNSEIAIVTFDGKKGMQESQKARIISDFSSSKAELSKIVKHITPSPNDTFLGAGLAKVENLLMQVNPKRTVVLLFTDGKAVNDKEKALKIIEKFKKSDVKLKVIAVGGADIDVIKSFTTTGYLFNATASDLKSMLYGISVANDEIFLRLNSFLENSPPLHPDDRVILYSSMMNVDAQNDFFIVPNITSQTFLNEVANINKKRDVYLSFRGAKLYVRIIGKITASKENELKIFWKNYFKNSGANIHFFANAPLYKSKVK